MVLQFPPADDQPVDRPAASKLKYKVVVGVGGLAGLFGIGSTLAANISLNNGGAVEFGQGVAQTAACDDDGFKVTPITHYDNSSSTFRLSKVQVSGLNLTPVGWDTGTDALSTDTAGVAANPGKYYDNGQWKKTCDGVVLDFNAYTNDPRYAAFTTLLTDSYASPPAPASQVTLPLGWVQSINNVGNWEWSGNRGFAVIFKYNDGDHATALHNGNEDINFATYGDNYSPAHNYGYGEPDYVNPINFQSLGTDNSSFDITPNSGVEPVANAISKITVQSMKYFPTNYFNHDDYDVGRSAPYLGVAASS